ncbi:MAG: hypothetical protein KDC44_05935 [Phaeodactylibacter sp.]|nr:hypothetical protein [Phaeodactylibacter sp.]
MNPWVAALLEIIKITIPALTVGLTVYYLFRQFLEKQYQLKALEYRQANQKNALPMKLGAYERLSLFCERISIPNLLFRLNRSEANAMALRLTLLTAIQQEFEHNITQQVYVSDNLWKIILFARNDVIDTINGVAEQVDPKAPGSELVQLLNTYLQQQALTPLDKAQEAIKKEAAVMI